MLSREELLSLSPVDGRYRQMTERLRAYASEYGLIRLRIFVECAYLEALSGEKAVGLGELSGEERFLLHTIAQADETDALLVKQIEKEGLHRIPATRHDVKAVEYFLKHKFKGTVLDSKSEWLHFGLTSEDINNISYALMLRLCVGELLFSLQKITEALNSLAAQYAALPMLARTHGQPASPTTFGKEMRVFAERLRRQEEALSSLSIFAKLNGATGNYNALLLAYPEVNWPAFSERFIEGFNTSEYKIRLSCNLYTTQIEPHDSYSELFHTLIRINTILVDFNQDMWRYISDGWLLQKARAGEVGSSTMPHKINPIDFENSEGNLQVANALFALYTQKLPVSRLQRDLSDSTVERNFGVACAHTLVGYEMALKGLLSIAPTQEAMQKALEAHPEVLAEAIQTILKKEGHLQAYEQLKDLTRGKPIDLQALRDFIAPLPLSKEGRTLLLSLSPHSYTGLATLLSQKPHAEFKTKNKA